MAMPDAFRDHAALFAHVQRAVLRAADPARAMERACELPKGAVHVLGVGKAALAMVTASLARIGLEGGTSAGGLVLCPALLAETEAASRLRALGVEVLACDHPWPTPRNTAAAGRVAEWLREIPERGALLACVSGGGSAYLTLPHGGVSLDELVLLTRALQASGADIRELNCVRKHAEQLKGGRLAARCACPVRVYVLSDVLGDPLDVIASGPFHPDSTTYADAIDALTRRNSEGVAPAISRLFRRGIAGHEAETPKTWEALGGQGRISHTVVLNNDSAVDAACEALAQAGVTVVQTRRRVEAQAGDVAIALAHDMCRARDQGEHQAWVIGGEWVVDSRDTAGVGGPSQELALAWAAHSAGFDGSGLMTLSTDGIDGPTDAAGAIVSGQTALQLARAGVHAEAALREHDSHAALAKVNALIRTGPTGTNINHVAVGLKMSAGGPLLMSLGVQE